MASTKRGRVAVLGKFSAILLAFDAIAAHIVLLAATPSHAWDLDCSDFQFQEQAQAVLDSNPSDSDHLIISTGATTALLAKSSTHRQRNDGRAYKYYDQNQDLTNQNSQSNTQQINLSSQGGITVIAGPVSPTGGTPS